MGISEVDKSSKEAKESNEPKTAAAPDPTSTAPGAFAADWSGFQAYSPMPPPPGFIASNPQAHPYMWGVQQFIPPYGTPLHPYVMYPHGSLYGHPTMAPGSYPFSPFVVPSTNGIGEASNNSPGNLEVVGKSSEAKGKLPIKRSKGSLGSLNMITWKNNEHNKSSGAIPNGLHSKSIASANEGSSEGSDANSKNGSQLKSGGQLDSEESSGEGNTDRSSQNGGRNTSQPMVNQAALVPVSAVGEVSGVPGPTTNLNIGMDYWGVDPSPPVPAAAMRGKMPAAAPIGSRDNIQSQLWIQDERELKRQRRKQSNRESARRSRLRKQAECDDLAQRAEVLKEENASLREEVSRIRSEYEQLFSQNASLKARLDELPGERCSRSSNNDAQ